MTARGASDELDGHAEFESDVLPEAQRLYGLALAIVGEPSEAEDVLQETLISAWRARSALRNPDKLVAWLTTICIHHAIRRRRLLHRRVLWSGPSWGAAEYLPEFLEGRMVDIHRALRSLSAPQRATVVLHHGYGLTVDECAAALGCRPGTARSHLGRAMTKLRKELADA
jgi:RNA polymerase sigma-70 factor (ECF subfamily)